MLLTETRFKCKRKLGDSLLAKNSLAQLNQKQSNEQEIVF